MDVNTLREVIMIVGLAAFLGVVWWAYAPSRRGRFERDAASVFDDDESDARSRAELARDTRAGKGA